MSKKMTVEQLDYLDLDELVDIWNNFCQENNWENAVFTNDQEGMELVFGTNVLEVARSIHFGEYSYVDDYFSIDGYNNVVSYRNKYDLLERIDQDELVNWINENPENFGNDSLLEIIEQRDNSYDETLEMIIGGE